MKNTRSWIGFTCLFLGSLFLGSCAKEFKLDSNAVNYRLNEAPLTVHGNRAQLDVHYQIAPKPIAKNGPTSKQPETSVKVYSGLCLNTKASTCAMPQKHRP